MVHGRDPVRTKAVAELISKRGGHAGVAVGDLTTEAGSAATVAAVVKTMGGIDILVNNVVSRLGQPTYLADLVCFIASPRSDFMTGSTIRTNGGATPTV